MTSKASPQQLYDNVQKIIKPLNNAIVAFSGGVDSTLLLKIALDTLGPKNVLAVTAQSESMPKFQFDQAIEISTQLGSKQEIIFPHEIDDPNYQANTPQRCYHCKCKIFDILTSLAQAKHYEAILCGDNADDIHDYRPGLQAVKEYHIISPLQKAGLTKNNIRQLSKHLNLNTWDKPAQPCLATRIPYGQTITPEKLQQIEQAETLLNSLDFPESRLRHHGQTARIEVPAEKLNEIIKLREKIIPTLKELGFTYITLDLQGFRSGSADETLTPNQK